MEDALVTFFAPSFSSAIHHQMWSSCTIVPLQVQVKIGSVLKFFRSSSITCAALWHNSREALLIYTYYAAWNDAR
jgi:hypothetical protein